MNKDVIPVVLVSQGQESVTLYTTPEISLPSGVLFSVCFALKLRQKYRQNMLWTFTNNLLLQDKNTSNEYKI